MCQQSRRHEVIQKGSEKMISGQNNVPFRDVDIQSHTGSMNESSYTVQDVCSTNAPHVETWEELYDITEDIFKRTERYSYYTKQKYLPSRIVIFKSGDKKGLYLYDGFNHLIAHSSVLFDISNNLPNIARNFFFRLRISMNSLRFIAEKVRESKTGNWVVTLSGTPSYDTTEFVCNIYLERSWYLQIQYDY